MPRVLQRALRAVRVTWCLSLASMLGYFALPWLIEELRYSIENHPARPAYYEVAQVPPWAFRLGGPLYGVWAVCGLALGLAAVIPRRRHVRALGRLRLLGAERIVVPARGAYRMTPVRSFVVAVGSIERLKAAYHARLGATLLLLWPGLVVAGIHASSPMRWFSTVMGCGIVFAGPQEYLPVFVAATMILLLGAPTSRRVLGPFAAGFECGSLTSR